MAEPNYYTSPPRVVAEMGSPSPTPQMQTNPSKFSSHFLFRGLFIAIFIALLPLFPSQAPEFINQTILTRSWELLHLLFVGIAVSYGLFSRRNIESEKENQLKIDTAQSYVARILEGSSVFDEDQVESPSGLDDSKIQTWNSQYFRGEPRVMVAKERSDLGTRRRISRTSSSEKPLLLPVRSLKSRVSDEGEVDLMHGVERIEGSGDGSGLDSEGSSQSPRRNGVREIGELKESVVLPSPIPWRSRSGRIEFNNERGPGIPRSYSLPRSAVTDEFGRFESPPPNSPIHWSPHPNSSPSPSPKKLSPSPSLSPEMRGKIGEDLGKKKGVHKRPPPPPPPLPPPPICSKSLPKEVNPKLDGGAFSMDMGRSFKNEVRNLSRSSSREDLPNNKDMDIDSWRLETRNKNRPEVRKSVRTIRGGEYAMEAKKGGDEVEMNGGRRPKEVDAVGAEKTGTRTASNQSSTSIEKQARSVRFSPPKIQNKESAQKFFVGPEDSDGDELHESSDGEVSAPASVVDTGPDGNEVDKKADEFIAKFREQIRLQRIESIKRSSGQRSGAKPR